MANISIFVDSTVVTYEQLFTYQVNVSFNSLTQAPGSYVTITCFLPEPATFLEEHSPSYPIQSVTTTPVPGGTNVTYTLVPLTESGVSLNFELYANFNLATPSNSQVNMEITIDEPNEGITTATASTVTLHAVPNYVGTLTTILPNSTGGAAGDLFVMDLIFTNQGDQWGPVTNFVISQTLPTGLSLDASYTISGMDISNNQFADPSADGITATIVNNTSFTFTIPSYRGTTYRIRFKGHIASELIIGDQYISTATYGYTNQTTSITPRTCNNIFTIETPSPTANCIADVPSHALPGAYLNAQFILANTGNTSLSSVHFHVLQTSSTPIPNISILTLITGIMTIPALGETVSIDYTLSGTSATDGSLLFSISLNTATSTTLNISELPIPAGTHVILDLIFSDVIPVGATLVALSVIVQVPDTATDPSYNYISDTLWWNNPAGGTLSVSNNTTITIDQLSIVAMDGTELSPNNHVIQGDIITYQAVINCQHSPLKQPAFVMILDPRLTYLPNSVSYSYYDFFGPTTNIPMPTPMIIPNYGGNGNTVLLINYVGANAYTFNQRAKITITLSFTVNQGATGTISQTMLLGTSGGAFAVASGYDTFNTVQPDGSLLALLTTPAFTNQLESSMSITSDFLVKASATGIYTQYPETAHAYAGDTVYYKLQLTNNGTVNISALEIVNIMPHLNDTGVILTTSQRGSEYVVYPVSIVDVTLAPVPTGQTPPNFTVYYSKSYDPVRFGAGLTNTIGTVNDWTTVLPADATTVKSYKVVGNNLTFSPGQTLTLNSIATLPSNVSPGLVAWDSFAAKITYTDNAGLALPALPVEPEKTGILILTSPPTTVTLGGFVWEDLARTGIYQAGDPGINDVLVLLYNTSNEVVQTVFTSPNAEGQDGYYTFQNASPGYYRIRFIPNDLIYSLTKQVLDNPNGSMPSPGTGYTPIIDMTTTAENLNINAGVINVSKINFVLQVNKEANKMLRNVIYNELLLDMKLEDVKSLIEKENKK